MRLGSVTGGARPQGDDQPGNEPRCTLGEAYSDGKIPRPTVTTHPLGADKTALWPGAAGPSCRDIAFQLNDIAHAKRRTNAPGRSTVEWSYHSGSSRRMDMRHR